MLGEESLTIRLFDSKKLTPHQRGLIRRAVRAALGRAANRKGELCVVFVSDAKIKTINRDTLGHNYATDVIAFPYDQDLPGSRAGDDVPPFGDIYIARGVARRQAREMGHDELTEWMTLAVHGALHLNGFNDKTAAQRRRMFARQDRILQTLRPSLRRRHGKK